MRIPFGKSEFVLLWALFSFLVAINQYSGKTYELLLLNTFTGVYDELITSCWHESGKDMAVDGQGMSNFEFWAN